MQPHASSHAQAHYLVAAAYNEGGEIEGVYIQWGHHSTVKLSIFIKLTHTQEEGSKKGQQSPKDERPLVAHVFACRS